MVTSGCILFAIFMILMVNFLITGYAQEDPISELDKLKAANSNISTSKLLAYAGIHLSEAIKALENGNSTALDHHLVTAEGQLSLVLDR
jgi:hypothetical protein